MSAWCREDRSGSWSCATAALILQFSVVVNSTPHGVLSVDGAFQIWVIPAVEECDLMGSLTHTALPCPPFVGHVPSISWNASYPAGSVDLSNLAAGLAGSDGTLPPSTWAIYVVDREPFVVEATSESPLVVVSS